MSVLNFKNIWENKSDNILNTKALNSAKKVLNPKSITTIKPKEKDNSLSDIRTDYTAIVIADIEMLDIKTNNKITIPKETLIKVGLKSENKPNHIEIIYTDKKGYKYYGDVNHKDIDDPVARELDCMIIPDDKLRPKVVNGEEDKYFSKAEAIWSAFSQRTDFTEWATTEGKEVPTFEYKPPTHTDSFNCWEAILIAAYNAGVINWEWIHELYNKGEGDFMETILTPEGEKNFMYKLVNKFKTRSYKVSINELENPKFKLEAKRGELIFFNDLSHVGMATGVEDMMYSFWIGSLLNKKLHRTTSIRSVAKYKYLNKDKFLTIKIGSPNW